MVKGNGPPLQDASRAVSLVCGRARESGLHARRIGIVGFSAGGHLVMAAATSFERRTYEPVEDVDQVSCRRTARPCARW